MRGPLTKEAFAGVRNASTNALDESDLSCCCYGRGCILFSDDELAASLHAEQHLQPWLDHPRVMVDRYDVRLLLHDNAQISKATHRRSRSPRTDSEEEEVDYERYRDLQPATRDTYPQSEPEPVTEGPADDGGACQAAYCLCAGLAARSPSSCLAATPAGSQFTPGYYAAVPFAYDTSSVHFGQEPTAEVSSPAPVLDAASDVAFTPAFAVPASVQNHLPTTERMHKVGLCFAHAFALCRLIKLYIVPLCCRSSCRLQSLCVKQEVRQSLFCGSSRQQTQTSTFWNQMINGIHTSDGLSQPSLR